MGVTPELNLLQPFWGYRGVLVTGEEARIG